MEGALPRKIKWNTKWSRESPRRSNKRQSKIRLKAKEEVIWSIKIGKACGEDDLAPEMMKIDEQERKEMAMDYTKRSVENRENPQKMEKQFNNTDT